MKNKQFTKFDQHKPRTDLLCPEVVIELAEVLGHGARKYEDNNWKKCTTWKRSYVGGAALRHIMAYMGGEEIDPDSGLPHLVHAMCSLMFARHLDLFGPDTEDSPEAQEGALEELEDNKTITHTDILEEALNQIKPCRRPHHFSPGLPGHDKFLD